MLPQRVDHTDGPGTGSISSISSILHQLKLYPEAEADLAAKVPQAKPRSQTSAHALEVFAYLESIFSLTQEVTAPF